MVNRIIGLIKTCNHCLRENYVRTDSNCPDCGNKYGSYKENKSPSIIAYLGSAEISRRTVEQLFNEGYIENPKTFKG